MSSPYRALVRRFFPNARIVADRFHVIRIINHHFLTCWRDIDPAGSRNRGLLSLMRRHRHNLTPAQQEKLAAYLLAHPALDAIYRFKQRLCYLLLKKHRNRKQCAALVPRKRCRGARRPRERTGARGSYAAIVFFSDQGREVICTCFVFTAAATGMRMSSSPSPYS